MPKQKDKRDNYSDGFYLKKNDRPNRKQRKPKNKKFRRNIDEKRQEKDS